MPLGVSVAGKIRTWLKKGCEDTTFGSAVPKSISGGGTGHGRNSIGGKSLRLEGTDASSDLGGVTALWSASGAEGSGVRLSGGVRVKYRMDDGSCPAGAATDVERDKYDPPR